MTCNFSKLRGYLYARSAVSDGSNTFSSGVETIDALSISMQRMCDLVDVLCIPVGRMAEVALVFIDTRIVG